MCILWLVVTVLETLSLSTTQKSAHITNCQCEMVYVHVWQMGHMCGLWWQAGWSLRLVGASSGTEEGSEDIITNTHVFIHTYTHLISPLINHQCFTTVHLPVSLEVGEGWR